MRILKGLKLPAAEVLKSRYTILRVGEEYTFTAELLEQIRQYLAEGVDPEVLLKAQKEEVMNAIKDYCTTPARKSVWKSLKESAGFDGKLEDMPLGTMKQLYHQLISD